MDSKIKCISMSIVFLCLLFSLNGCGKKEKTSVKTEIEKTINVSKLNTAKFTYNGIAETMIDGDKYCISYKGSVKIGIDFEKVKLSDDAKTVTLPQLEIQDEIVNPGEYQYLPENPDFNVKKAAEICEKDLKKEVSKNEKLWETAKNNTEQKIKNLMKPFIGDIEDVKSVDEIVFEWKE